MSAKMALPAELEEWAVVAECKLNKAQWPDGRTEKVFVPLPGQHANCDAFIQNTEKHPVTVGVFYGFHAKESGIIRYIFDHIEQQ